MTAWKETEAQWKDLSRPPKKDWKPWCFRGLSNGIGNEKGGCVGCLWMDDCRKPKDGA
ncbi:MAG TPA: hypothetical protein VGK23_02325 [Methanomassiliicoccales archaeon]